VAVFASKGTAAAALFAVCALLVAAVVSVVGAALS